jgi:hypothetical protein
MAINLEDLNRLAYANEKRLRDAKGDVETIKACNDTRRSLSKIAAEAGFVRGFDMSFRRPFEPLKPR